MQGWLIRKLLDISEQHKQKISSVKTQHIHRRQLRRQYLNSPCYLMVGFNSLLTPAITGVSPVSIAESKNPSPVNQSITYAVEIRKADNTTESHIIPTGMLTWTSPKAYSVGTYNIVLKTTNTVDGKVVSSMSEPISATILGDQATQVQELNIVSLNYVDAIISYGVMDLDGVRN
jgi:hypothetical protein